MQTAIIGAGTIIFQDEGIGVYAQKYIEENYSFQSDVTIVDGGVLGFKLMTYYQSYDRVLILDTITMNDKAGSIYNLPASQLIGLGSYKQTAHEVEIVEMLEICSLLEKMADINIIGIVPYDIQSVNIGLSKDMKTLFYDFVDVVMKQLQKDGIKFSKNNKHISLDEIILNYKNPSNSR